jgi:hypothetical protein
MVLNLVGWRAFLSVENWVQMKVAKKVVLLVGKKVGKKGSQRVV